MPLCNCVMQCKQCDAVQTVHCCRDMHAVSGVQTATPYRYATCIYLPTMQYSCLQLPSYYAHTLLSDTTLAENNCLPPLHAPYYAVPHLQYITAYCACTTLCSTKFAVHNCLPTNACMHAPHYAARVSSTTIAGVCGCMCG